MKKTIHLVAMLSLLSALNSHLSTAFAQGTAFTYQGRLNVGGSPANGLYDYRFKLYTDPLGSFQVGSTYLTNAIYVTNGLFITTVDFGSGVFTGSTNWLEVDVKTNLAGSYTVLTPLQGVTPTPYAIFAATASNVSGTVSAAQISGAVANGNLPTSPTVSGTVTAGAFAGNGASVTNVNAAALNGLTSGNFWQLGGNNVSGGQFLGSTNNQPVEIWANGQRVLRLDPSASSGAPNVIGGAAVNFVANGVFAATIGGGGCAGSYTNSVVGSYGTVSGGAANTAGFVSVVGGGYLNNSLGLYSFIGGGQVNTISNLASFDCVIGGGFANVISSNSFNSAIVGGQGNRISTNSPYSIIGGGNGNIIYPDAYNIGEAVIVGGQGNLITNAEGAFIGGGSGNIVNGDLGVVGGGYENTSINAGVVVGGSDNYAWGGDFVGAGEYNTNNGAYSTIGGGEFNTVGGNSLYGTVPGGQSNVVNGYYGFAAGHQAQSLHQGAFVWADSQAAPFASTGNDQFLIRAQGNVGINKANPGATLHVANGSSGVSAPNGSSVGAFESSGNGYVNLLTPSANESGILFGNTNSTADGGILYNSGSITRGLEFRTGGNNNRVVITSAGNVGIGNFSPGYLLVVGGAGSPAYCNGGNWVNASDRNMKQDFAPVPAAEVLAKVVALPVQSWDYKAQPGEKHIGPVAQDFHAAFGLNGADDTHISTVDEGGVALAAIKGLNEKVDEKEATIQQQSTEIEALKQSVAELKQLVQALADKK